jgi:hypothetical protein
MSTSRLPTYVVGAALIAALLVALGVPLVTLLPIAALLVCPLMMVVMMRGMGGMHGHGEDHLEQGGEHGPTRRTRR